MGTGLLTVQVRTGDDALPIAGARVTVRNPDGRILYETTTDAAGNTGKYPLTAPDVQYTLTPNYGRPAYSVVDVDVSAPGFVTEHIRRVEIVDTSTTILPVNMTPLAAGMPPNDTITIPPPGLLQYAEDLHVADPGQYILAPDSDRAVVPEYITVHLGVPTDATARNVRVRFVDYIKNCVSSEIYPTWPYNSIVANVHVIVTFALNRVYTEWYRSRGYNFDITNSTAYDQFYRDGGPVFENISRIVDGIFNVYARRRGFRNPFFTQFCNGSTVTCPGLSQWGTVDLANRGMTPLEILRHYYPDDLELVTSNNITGITESYPGYVLRLGSQGEAVRRIQNFLNRIRVNFPLIPRISNPNGVFGADTQDAVRTFQRVFNLEPDGIVGRDTWNKISFIYVGVIRLGELDSEGERHTIGENPPTSVLGVGSRGEDVMQLQFILDRIAPYYPTIPIIIKDGVFDAGTSNAVIEFQKTFGLTPDGAVGPATWNKLYAVYRGIQNNVPVPPVTPQYPGGAPQYPGTALRVGSSGQDVRLMQTYMNTIRIVYPDIPYVVVDGVFGEATRRQVVAFQQEFMLTPDGIIGSATWNKIVEMFMLVTGNASISVEYPGAPLRIGSTGSAVRLMQNYLNDLRARYPSAIPPLTVDGAFGPQTQAAVIAFQRIMGLAADGIIGPVTWRAIIEQRNSLTPRSAAAGYGSGIGAELG